MICTGGRAQRIARALVHPDQPACCWLQAPIAAGTRPFHRLQDPTSGLEVVEVPRPTPGQGEVLVRITLRPVNPADIFSLQVRRAAPAAPAVAARTRRVPLRVPCAVVGMQAAQASRSLIWFAVPQSEPYFHLPVLVQSNNI